MKNTNFACSDQTFALFRPNDTDEIFTERRLQIVV